MKQYKHFDKFLRNELSILLKKGYSYRDIGSAIEMSHSSISREVKNNSVNGKYDPEKANHKARVKRLYSKYQGMKVVNMRLEKYIRRRLKLFWTPEQIAGRLKRKNNNKTVISAKSIYEYLYSPYGQHLCKYLPSKRYYPKKRKKKKLKKVIIPNRISIENRPKIVDFRIRFGDWEGDTLGKPKYMPETIVGMLERKSRRLLVVKVSRLKYAMNGFKRLITPYHDTINSMTLDNGVENVRYEELNVSTYFCHPYSSCEKGSIENSFKRLRRFIPKKSNPKNYTNSDLHDIMNVMNNTPRKCLDYRTPNEVFSEGYSLAVKQSSGALGGKM